MIFGQIHRLLWITDSTRPLLYSFVLRCSHPRNASSAIAPTLASDRNSFQDRTKPPRSTLSILYCPHAASRDIRVLHSLSGHPHSQQRHAPRQRRPRHAHRATTQHPRSAQQTHRPTSALFPANADPRGFPPSGLRRATSPVPRTGISRFDIRESPPATAAPSPIRSRASGFARPRPPGTTAQTPRSAHPVPPPNVSPSANLPKPRQEKPLGPAVIASRHLSTSPDTSAPRPSR